MEEQEHFKKRMQKKLEKSKAFLEEKGFEILEVSDFPDFSYRITARNPKNGHNETFRLTERELGLLEYKNKHYVWRNVATFSNGDQRSKRSYLEQMRHAVNGQ